MANLIITITIPDNKKAVILDNFEKLFAKEKLTTEIQQANLLKQEIIDSIKKTVKRQLTFDAILLAEQSIPQDIL